MSNQTCGNCLYRGVCEESRWISDTPDPWKQKAEAVAYWLRIFIHAHDTGNSVPPEMVKNARKESGDLAAPDRKVKP
jgi:hypothetical protein